jgi:hypothetical protein
MTYLLTSVLLAFLATAPKPDTVIRWTGQTRASTMPLEISHPDTTITYHSLAQLPKDTTKRWEIAVVWKLESWQSNVKDGWESWEHALPQLAMSDTMITHWRFAPDSAITEKR